MNNLQPQVISKCSICNISCKNGKFIKNNLNNYNIYCQNCLNKNNFDILCNKNIKINIKNSDNAPYVTKILIILKCLIELVIVIILKLL